ncbi:MAG TPA: DUF58 domain-containing protein [Burkholderiales bacterium]|nr:DUF58 domain-containing protein [Burkholderiales bacterium]
MANPGALLDESFLHKLEVLSLVMRRPVYGQLKGAHRSRRVGSGMVFTDFRPYSAGDDIRNIDWSAYLRMDRLILKLFEEEADLPVYLFVDASRSMDFGTPGKFDCARKLAAALCYVALLSHDRVNLVSFADAAVQALPARRGKSQAPQAFRFLESIRPGGQTGLHSALRRFFSLPRTRGLVLLISDFLDPDGIEPGFALLRRLRHETAVIHVISPEEREPRLPEEVVLVDAEDGVASELDLTPSLLAAYREAFQRNEHDIEAYCRKYGWAYLQALTEVPLEHLTLKLLRQQGLLR